MCVLMHVCFVGWYLCVVIHLSNKAIYKCENVWKLHCAEVALRTELFISDGTIQP